MKWRKHDDYAYVSDNGEYSIAKIGRRGGFRYEAWRTRSHRDGPHLVGTNVETAQQARKLCEDDSEQ